MPASNDLILDFEPAVNTSTREDEVSWSVEERKSIANTTVAGYFVFKVSQGAAQMMSKLKSFQQLRPNWDSYGAIPPTVENIDRAISFVWQADRNLLPFYFAAPGPNGEIVLEFKEGNKEAAAYFNPDGTTELILNRGDDFILEGTLEANYKDLLRFVNSQGD